jgi:hypothetical protein
MPGALSNGLLFRHMSGWQFSVNGRAPTGLPPFKDPNGFCPAAQSVWERLRRQLTWNASRKMPARWGDRFWPCDRFTYRRKSAYRSNGFGVITVLRSSEGTRRSVILFNRGIGSLSSPCSRRATVGCTPRSIVTSNSVEIVGADDGERFPDSRRQ